MRARAGTFAAGAAFAGLLVLELVLGPVSAETAARFPEAAHLSSPVLALALAFCLAGQAGLLALTVVRGRGGRLVAAAALTAMAGTVVAIEVLTMLSRVTPPLLGLVGWPAAAGLAVAGVVLAVRTRGAQSPARMPAARAGSA